MTKTRNQFAVRSSVSTVEDAKINMHHDSELLTFDNAGEIVKHFELTELSTEDLNMLKTASDKGTPSFVCVNPYSKEIHDFHRLIIRSTQESLDDAWLESNRSI